MSSAETTRRWLARALVVLGLICLGWVGFVTARAALYRRAHATPPAQATTTLIPDTAAPTGGADDHATSEPLVGTLKIPRLNFSKPVAEGDDDGTLAVAIGHLSDTSVPWRAGNTALAGHRDTDFRALRDIRIGDHITLSTARGDFEYRIRDTLIVEPNDVWVVQPTMTPQLTLVTCYPFTFIGHAPHRFVVMADRIDAGP